MTELDWPEILLRLGIAAFAGSAIGLNRDLQGKPIGLKTLGIVGLSTATVVLLAAQFAEPGRMTDATSRVIQGILTGIGFLGAGVIVHARHGSRVRGLTSAACTLLAACIGVACGIGQWKIIGIALVLAFVLLIVGRRTEHWLHRVLGGKGDPHDAETRTESPPQPQSSDAGPHQPGR
jgi:putative Mg2+ transporter-C (MgtC) family protein